MIVKLTEFLNRRVVLRSAVASLFLLVVGLSVALGVVYNRKRGTRTKKFDAATACPAAGYALVDEDGSKECRWDESKEYVLASECTGCNSDEYMKKSDAKDRCTSEWGFMKEDELDQKCGERGLMNESTAKAKCVENWGFFTKDNCPKTTCDTTRDSCDKRVAAEVAKTVAKRDEEYILRKDAPKDQRKELRDTQIALGVGLGLSITLSLVVFLYYFFTGRAPQPRIIRS